MMEMFWWFAKRKTRVSPAGGYADVNCKHLTVPECILYCGPFQKRLHHKHQPLQGDPAKQMAITFHKFPEEEEEEKETFIRGGGAYEQH